MSKSNAIICRCGHEASAHLRTCGGYAVRGNEFSQPRPHPYCLCNRSLWDVVDAEIEGANQDSQRLAALALILLDASVGAIPPGTQDEFRRLAERLAPQQAEQAQDKEGVE